MATPFERVSAAPLHDRCESVMVRSRDGVRLATDVYRSDDAPGPTVLIRVPYDKTGEFSAIPAIADYFRARGYHVVAQDVRGKFRSEGETLAYVNEASDGHDTLDWIIGQEFSDGIVGMWGDSYFGFTQWAAASTGHPALRAISPRVTGTRLGELPTVRPGDESRDVEESFDRVYLSTYFLGNDDFYWEPDWSRRPYAELVEDLFATVGARSTSYDMTFPQATNPSPFPHGHPFDAHAIPTLMTIGWWDNCAPLQWSDHQAIAARPSWSLNEYLLIDSTDHMSNRLTTSTDGPLPREQQLAQILDPTIEFFDVFLRGRGDVRDIAKVRWNLAHTDGFRSSATWPPAGTRDHVLHLSAAGELGPEPEPTSSALTWTHDPDDLVPSPARDPHVFLEDYPDERAWSDRADVLVFDASPVTTDVDLVGGVTMSTWCASSGPSMDLFVRLLDVDPDGSARLIARGQRHLVDAVHGGHLEIDLGQVGYRLRSGHGLRLHVASSDFPEHIAQPGTGEHPWLAVEVRRNEQSLSVGGDAGARLVLHTWNAAGAG